MRAPRRTRGALAGADAHGDQRSRDGGASDHGWIASSRRNAERKFGFVSARSASPRARRPHVAALGLEPVDDAIVSPPCRGRFHEAHAAPAPPPADRPGARTPEPRSRRCQLAPSRALISSYQSPARSAGQLVLERRMTRPFCSGRPRTAAATFRRRAQRENGSAVWRPAAAVPRRRSRSAQERGTAPPLHAGEGDGGATVTCRGAVARPAAATEAPRQLRVGAGGEEEQREGEV